MSPRAPNNSVLAVLRGLRMQTINWYITGPISWLVMRCPPRRFLSNTWLARLVLTVRLKNGRTIRCRVNEFLAFVEVYVMTDYDIPGMDWTAIRSIVDCGANVGAATVWLADRAPSATIVAVEPSAAALSLLTSNIERNGLAGRVTVVPVALGATSGTGQLTPSDATVGTQVHPGAIGPIGSSRSVSVITFGELLGATGLTNVDLLKLDCEGCEYGLICASSLDTLRSVRAIVGEYHLLESWGPEMLGSALRARGFDFHCRRHPRDATLGTFYARRQPISPS